MCTNSVPSKGMANDLVELEFQFEIGELVLLTNHPNIVRIFGAYSMPSPTT